MCTISTASVYSIYNTEPLLNAMEIIVSLNPTAVLWALI